MRQKVRQRPADEMADQIDHDKANRIEYLCYAAFTTETDKQGSRPGHYKRVNEIDSIGASGQKDRQGGFVIAKSLKEH